MSDLRTRGRWVALLRASHPAPALAVTTVTALLAGGAGHTLRTGLVVTAAVAAGQLSIGWSNDLLDAARDRQVGREDKPIAQGQVSERLVVTALVIAVLACVALSLACGVRSAMVHLVLVVGSGWAYNVGMKGTAGSAVPYALAFGSLPAVVTLALPDPRLPALWTVAAGALLGVGAHLLNALPDLADDASTGVRGLPHRLGERGVRLLAPLVLLAGSAAAVLGAGDRDSVGPWIAFGGTVLLAAVALTARGRWPFLAAIGIALIDVVGLVTSN